MIVLDRLALAPGIVLLVADEGDGVPRPVPWLVGADRRAGSGDGAATALVGLLSGGSRTLGPFRVTTWHHAAVSGERAFPVDRTNESLVVGERAVITWFRAADPGPHQAPAVLDALQRHGFAGIPAPWGLLEWTAPGDDAPRLLASVRSLLPGASDGWTWVVGDLREAVITGSVEAIHQTGVRLGTLVGELHAALADDGPTAATPDDLAAWDEGADRDLAQALDATAGDAHALLAGCRDRVRAATRAPAEALGSPLIRVHGDLHVGRVLRQGTGPDATYALVDFGHHPIAPPSERRRAQPPALDLAVLVQSLQHAAVVLRHHETQHHAGAVAAAVEACEDALVTTYAATVADRGHHRLLQPGLVHGLRLRQVCREFTYAATRLSRWSYVPETALPALLPTD